MESKLFGRFDVADKRNEKFSECLQYLTTLSEMQLQSIIVSLNPLLQARTEAETDPVIKQLESETGLSRIQLNKVFSIAQFFLRAFHDEDTKSDSPELWFKDLIVSGILTQEVHEKFIFFVDHLIEHAYRDIEKRERDLTTQIGLLPYFRGIATSVELRGVFKDEYNIGTDINAYKPEITGVVPVVTVAIKVDSGNEKTFIFQVSPENIEYIISELKSAQINMKHLNGKIIL